MKYILLGLLISFNTFAGTDCYPDPQGGIHCSGSEGRTDCYPDPQGGIHCN
jgi:hypothetical protein